MPHAAVGINVARLANHFGDGQEAIVGVDEPYRDPSVATEGGMNLQKSAVSDV